MSDEIDDFEVPDPLLEDFERLQRTVFEKKIAEFRASCPHDSTMILQKLNGERYEICNQCFTWLPSETP